MIKFFRHIRFNLMETGKTGKYFKYAIGEIILVVIGILIALQINNSNNKSIEKSREIKYLTNIKIDLNKDIKGLDYNIEFREKKSRGTQKIIDQINGMPIEDLTETTYNVLNTLNQERFQPSNVTYNDLVSSGNMNLISNDSIKLYLFELSLLYQKNVFGVEHETHEYEEFISKPMYQYADIERMKPVFLRVKTAEEMSISEQDFDELFESKEFKNGCVVSIWTTEQMVQIYMDIKTNSNRIIDIIDMELKK